MNAIKQGYKQTKVGIIPEDWEVVRLGEVVEVLTDYHANGSYEILKDNVELLESEEYAVMVRTTNFEQNNFDNNLIYINEHSYNFLKKSKVYFGDIIINKIANAGATYFMPKINKPVSLGMNLFLLRIKNKYSKFFIYYQIKKREVFLKALASGTSTLTITKDDVRNFRIPTPFFKEQEKIAEILATWDEAISLHVKLIGEKEQLKIGLMQKLLSGEVRFEGFCDKWEEVKLGEIADIYQPKTISQTELTQEGYNVYGANGIIGKYYQYNHELEQIAVTCRGNTCGTVNYTNPKSWITGNAMVINLDNSKKAIKPFIYYLFLNTNFTYLISGSGQPQITGNIKNHKLKLPLLPEQQKVAEVLSLADDELNLLKKELEVLKEQKKGLMQKLLTGEVRVMA